MTDDEKEVEEACLAEMADPIESDVEAPEASDIQGITADKEVEDERTEVFAGYTAEELQESLALIPKLQTALDTTNGTFGNRLAEQQAIIDELQGREIGNGQIDPNIIERLGEEYPELAELLSPDGIISADESEETEETEETTQDADIEALVDARMQKFEQDQATREYNEGIQTLESIHPDWQDTAMYSVNQDGTVDWKNKQFGDFVDTMTENEREVLFTSWNPAFVGRKITEFKQSIKPAQNQTIANAAHPRGVTSSRTLSEADEEAAAFAAEMKNY